MILLIITKEVLKMEMVNFERSIEDTVEKTVDYDSCSCYSIPTMVAPNHMP